jgi:hypothetical protein
MLRKLALLSAFTRLATSTPVPQGNKVETKKVTVERPSNFYIEPDLDITKPYTEEARFSVTKYGSVADFWTRLATNFSASDRMKSRQWE